MDLTVIATATTVLSNAITAMKYVREVSDGSDDLELKSRINDLYTALLDVRVTVLNLDNENRELRAKLAKKDQIVGPLGQFGYFFYKDKPDQPLCPKCAQKSPSEPRFLSPLQQRAGGHMRICYDCHFIEIEIPVSTAPQNPDPYWWT